MTTQSQSARVSRQGCGPSNAEILGLGIEACPPTIDDIEYTALRGVLTLAEVIDLTMTRMVGAAWENGTTLSDLRWQWQLDDRLPPPSLQDSGVYLVTAPRGNGKYRFIHWSLYSQGHFYHLTAANSDAHHYFDAKSDHSSTSPDLRRRLPVSLKVQNVLDPNSAYFTPQTSATEKTALQAYHVGCTRFTPDQILRIATFVIGQIKSYNVFSENCQFFAVAMADRTVMTRRNCSVFVGHMHQIAAWDSAGGPGREQGFHTRGTGYVLANPRTGDELARRPSMQELLWTSSWRGLRINSHARQIAVLYREGEHALRAYDPQGKRTGVRRIWYSIRKDSSFIMRPFCEQYGEIREDVGQGRWRDVWYGRLERRRKSYVDKEIKVRNGSGLTRVLLPVYRWSRGVTEEERRMWSAEAAGTLEMEAAPGRGRDEGQR